MAFPNTFPHEVIGSPMRLYYKAAGSAAPLATLDDPETDGWTRVGSNLDKSYSEEGVRFLIPQEFNFFRGLGSAAPLKAFRASEDVTISVSLADMTLEQFSHALNQNAVSEVGLKRKVGLSRGLVVATIALLARGPSPYMDNSRAQWWIPYAVNVSTPEVVVRRDNATVFEIRWTGIVNPDAASDDETLGFLEALIPSS